MTRDGMINRWNGMNFGTLGLGKKFIPKIFVNLSILNPSHPSRKKY
jgi:hypothetical protein